MALSIELLCQAFQEGTLLTTTSPSPQSARSARPEQAQQCVPLLHHPVPQDESGTIEEDVPALDWNTKMNRLDTLVMCCYDSAEVGCVAVVTWHGFRGDCLAAAQGPCDKPTTALITGGWGLGEDVDRDGNGSSSNR